MHRLESHACDQFFHCVMTSSQLDYEHVRQHLGESPLPKSCSNSPDIPPDLLSRSDSLHRGVEHLTPQTLLPTPSTSRWSGSSRRSDLPTAPKGLQCRTACNSARHGVWQFADAPRFGWQAIWVCYCWRLLDWLSFDCALCGLLAIISIAIGALVVSGHGHSTPAPDLCR